MTNEKKMSFEESMKKLEEIVEKLDNGNIPLKESISLYKEGMDILADTNQLLKKYEEDISLITEQENGSTKIKEIKESELTD